MKKRICIVLSVLMIFMSFAICANAQETNEMKVLVTSDTHWADVKSVNPDGFFRPRADLGQLTALSAAIFDRFLKDAAASDAQFVLISGDLTDSGSDESARAVAGLLADFEDKTGKQVFVVPGNHDLHMGDTPDDHLRFRENYFRFGYDAALAIDEATSSYVADLSGGYRLLAINSNKADGGGLLTDALLTWIEAQVRQAQADGKKLIAMMHQQLLEHMTMEQRIDGFYIIDNFKDVRKKFAEWNIRVTFTGHMHMGDIAEYNGKNTIYDVTTYSLANYPLRYRDVTFTDNQIEIQSREISNLDPQMLPAGYSDAQREMILNNPVGYAYGCQEDSLIGQYVSGFVDADALTDTLGLEPDSFGAKLIKRILPNVLIPLYGEGETVEAKAKALGYELPKSDYETVGDLISAFWAALVRGDEDLGGSSPEGRLFLDAAYALFAARAAENNPVVRLALRVKLIALLGLKGLNNFMVRKALDVILTGLMVDKAPADNDVTLPGYETDTGAILYKLTAFTKRLTAFARMLVSF